jgi:hypothetical protein
MKPVDKLFHDKLARFETAPDPNVWARVEQRLQKKIKIVWMWRAAAMITAVAMLLYIVALRDASESTQRPEFVMNAKTETSENPGKPHEAHAAETTPTVEEKELRQVTTHKLLMKPEARVARVADILPVANAAEEKVDVKNATITYELPAVTNAGVYLEYTLPTVAPAVLAMADQNNTTELTPAAAPKKQKKGWLGVAKLAQKVNEGEAWGNLRDMKNELFAFELKGEKSKQQ